jgi:hypothetical protein
MLMTKKMQLGWSYSSKFVKNQVLTSGMGAKI